MLDVALQERFARGCRQATVGYAAAATAACTGFASSILDFWCTALSGLVEPSSDVRPVGRASAGSARSEVPFGQAFEDWTPFSWLDPQRYEPMMRIEATSSPADVALAFANTVPLRGTSTSWPMAHMLIESGVPRTVAWPTAEASAAALDAADAASNGYRQVVASYHTDSGFAGTVRGMTPTLMALMATTAVTATPLHVLNQWPRLLAS